MAHVHAPQADKKFHVRKYFPHRSSEVSYGNEPAFNAANLLWGIAVIFLLATLMSIFTTY